ncbi:MAG: insulinase family protein [Firmicutes bacterium]|nr:insulinase family protein [Bacillota bacterium]MCM1401539.1 insulinase family protein [Bacteroides sp.]MCM1476585.1 insulinase family protein [Bacteroides sp.]
MNSSHSNINIITFPSGLKLVHQSTDREVEYFGASVNAGSRDDPPGQEGLAHFVEHVIFKGTTHRRSWHIINRMEACGGELNAYTTKENTVVYTIFPKGNFLRAADLIADLMCYSTFPASELDKEREVVADELSQYRDIPSEAVFDDFEDYIFAGSRLGHNILGNSSALAEFDSETCRNYIEQNFTASRTVIFYSGSRSVKRVVRDVERLFAPLSLRKSLINRRAPELPPPFHKVENLNNHQANTVTGLVIPSMFSPRRHAIALLTNILGGPGMNSLLNVEMRERRGLVYTVEASTTLLTDTGLLSIFFGCDHADTTRCSRIVRSTIGRIADHGVTPKFLEAAKKQYLGQLTLASDVRENSVMAMARSTLYYGKVADRQQTAELITSTTAEQIRHEAENILSNGLSTLTLE